MLTCGWRVAAIAGVTQLTTLASLHSGSPGYEGKLARPASPPWPQDCWRALASHGEHNFPAIFLLFVASYIPPLFIFFLTGSCQVLEQQGGDKRTSVQHREFHRILHVESPFSSLGESHVGFWAYNRDCYTSPGSMLFVH